MRCWKDIVMRLSDFVEFNPKVKLSHDLDYPYVEMDEIIPGRRYVRGRLLRPFAGGGTKFQRDDVLFARITPCLENGKIAQFRNPNFQQGFGSTEFFIFRAKENISDPGYVFYLFSDAEIRQIAEKSMVGASGRQRANINS